MKPRQYRAPMPLSRQRSPRKSKDSLSMQKAEAYHAKLRSTTLRERLIESGVITPKKDK